MAKLLAIGGSGFAEETSTESDSFSSLTYSATTIIDFSSTENIRQVTLTGNITFTTSNRASARSRIIRIINGATLRTFTWPAGWVWIGGLAPGDIAASKTAILSVMCFGTNDSDIVAAYSVQL